MAEHRAFEELPLRWQARIDRIDDFNCWIWTGFVGKNGYGLTNIGHKGGCLVHRLIYEALIGQIPTGLQIDHLCKVKHCVNPNHLEAVTSRVNLSRSEAISTVNSRKTHCPNGHRYAGDNLWIVPKTGARRCRTCKHNSRVQHPEYLRFYSDE